MSTITITLTTNDLNGEENKICFHHDLHAKADVDASNLARAMVKHAENTLNEVADFSLNINTEKE